MARYVEITHELNPDCADTHQCSQGNAATSLNAKASIASTQDVHSIRTFDPHTYKLKQLKNVLTHFAANARWQPSNIADIPTIALKFYDADE
ncbi:hypothetical protein [Xanthomonas sp. 3058]|uniref:hypothetical protein n=1 Tax=Xanthomonas sp. 3058 TaxID=3035314 RepID=UPI0016172408|nr:hypothetical protein [Xanthomonas sp. 3058]MBB5865966.1 hypothetical protein [Xanthomonas sp. 3058]